MTKLGLTLNEAKTSLKDARRESFDFLGYTLGPQRYRKDGHWYLGASPSKKSVQRVKTKIGDLLGRATRPLAECTQEAQPASGRLDRVLRLRHSLAGVSGRRRHVYDRVRVSSCRRHKTEGRGMAVFPEKVHGELGVLRLQRVHLGQRREPCDETSRKAGCGKSARPV